MAIPRTASVDTRFCRGCKSDGGLGFGEKRKGKSCHKGWIEQWENGDEFWFLDSKHQSKDGTGTTQPQ